MILDLGETSIMASKPLFEACLPWLFVDSIYLVLLLKNLSSCAVILTSCFCGQICRAYFIALKVTVCGASMTT